MAFNPSLPTELTIADAAQMRSQFNGIVDLIQTIPVGLTGPAEVNAAVIDGVTTANPGDSPGATVALTAQTLHFSFSIPRGDAGATGATGPAFTSIAVDAVNTLPAGNQATVQTSFDGTTVRFTFGIPEGQ
jgi:hypothetical protein